jgi:DNA repair protein RecN (Recombination protein N)
MLTQLTIKNFGLIYDVSIDLEKGLDVLTGETGAGKSIIIDALKCVLGSRLSTSSIRDEKQPCVVEAVFDLAGTEAAGMERIREYLGDAGDTTLIISRSATADGRNKIKINGSAVTVAQLHELGVLLVDFHGTGDHQMLLGEESHIVILDRLTDFKGYAAAYREAYEKYNKTRRAIEELSGQARNREQELDVLSHQITELEQVPLDEAAHDAYMTEQTKVNNTEALFAAAQSLRDVFENDEQGVVSRIRAAFAHMKTLERIDGSSSEMAQRLDRVQDDTDALLSELQSYIDSLSFDADRAAAVNAVCDRYNALKRKYGSRIGEVVAFYTKAKERFELLSDYDQNDAELKKRLSQEERAVKEQAAEMTKLRKKAARVLEKTIEAELGELGIKQVRFECRITPSEPTPHGSDHVIFYISPNVGEELKPLAQIVSSGEAARVMLALKKALIDVDPVPVLVFDEIDAQIGGRLGEITGKKLRELSRKRQVLLITHLPQIAGFADAHFKVTKQVTGKRTVTTVCALSQKERVAELAHMMSGESRTQIAVKHAEDMLARAQK